VEIAYTGTPLRDGSILTTIPGITGRGLDIIRISADAVTIDTVLATAADESFVTPSPDGRWFAYISDVSGRPEVYIRALGRQESNVQLQVSLEGATEPVWSRNGREIFYRSVSLSGTQLMAAALDLGDAPRVVRRTALFDVSGFDTSAPHANYDVSPDGTWFVFARRGGANHVVVLQNVPEMARRIATTGAMR
jgi:Tol biopolymer transport system component